MIVDQLGVYSEKILGILKRYIYNLHNSSFGLVRRNLINFLKIKVTYIPNN